MENFFIYLLPTLLCSALCIFPSLILGAIAQRKGRSFGWWTFGPVLMALCFTLIIRLIHGRDDGSLSLLVFYVFPILWIVYLIVVLIAPKTAEKRRWEILEEEQIRASFRIQHENSTKKDAPPRNDNTPNPFGKTINDLYKK